MRLLISFVLCFIGIGVHPSSDVFFIFLIFSVFQWVELILGLAPNRDDRLFVPDLFFIVALSIFQFTDAFIVLSVSQFPDVLVLLWPALPNVTQEPVY